MRRTQEGGSSAEYYLGVTNPYLVNTRDTRCLDATAIASLVKQGLELREQLVSHSETLSYFYGNKPANAELKEEKEG